MSAAEAGPAAFDLTIRCDGSAAIGLGHVMRCVALAQAAARCARVRAVRFAMREDAVANDVPRAHGFDVDVVPRALSPGEEALHLARGRRFAPGAWVVVDGYHLEDLVAPLRARGARVCAIDDLPTGPGAAAEADLLVNPSPAAVATRGLALGRRVLLGPRFAPVRHAFRCARLARGAGDDRAASSSRPLRLLVLSGGSDVAGLTARVLAGLRAAGPLPPLEPVVVLGPAAPDPPAALLGSKIEVVRAPRDMAAVMASADLAVSAAGTSVLELATLGVPALMVTVVDNQAGVAAAVEAAGAGLDLGPCAALDAAALSSALHEAARAQPAWSAAARRLVDGGGARRVVGAIARLAAEEER